MSTLGCQVPGEKSKQRSRKAAAKNQAVVRKHQVLVSGMNGIRERETVLKNSIKHVGRKIIELIRIFRDIKNRTELKIPSENHIFVVEGSGKNYRLGTKAQISS